MVRECRPPAREPVRSWLARRSTMATSTPANANSPANISPVGPPPAITTACSVIATLRSAPAALLATQPQVPPSVRRPLATHVETSAFRGSYFRRLRRRAAILRYAPGLTASPPVRYSLKVPRRGRPSFPLSSVVNEQPPREGIAILMAFAAVPTSAGRGSPNACTTPSTPATTSLKSDHATPPRCGDRAWAREGTIRSNMTCTDVEIVALTSSYAQGDELRPAARPFVDLTH